MQFKRTNKAMKAKIFIMFATAIGFFACGSSVSTNEGADSASKQEPIAEDIPVISSIELYNPIAEKILDAGAQMEELAKGFSWSEGPLWVAEINALLFSDVPKNIVYKWSEKEGLSVYLNPSGYTGPETNKEDGANGLMLDREGDLIICQHGDRRLATMLSGLQNPSAEYTSLIDNHDGKKFNSPNDLAIKSNGNIYFTDPSYGIKDKSDRELDFHGVYKLGTNGELTLLVDSISWPNGIAFSKDEKTIYIANSDPKLPVWYAYKVDNNGLLKDGRIFYDASSEAKTEKGLPDGLKVHSSGLIFATGPGGVLVFSPQGEKLAVIKTSKSTANCAFDTDEKYIYLTTTDRLLRLKMK
jgi:gluconolactonase